MARLTCVYRLDDTSGITFGKRQLPLAAFMDNNLMMLMDLNSKGLVFDHPNVKGKELEEFTRKYSILSTDELKQSLEVSRTDFISVLSQSVPCVGCRRSVERLYYQLMLSGHPTLDPIVITNDGILTVDEEKMHIPQVICTLLHKHNILLNSLLENQPRNKKSSRCTLHSLDSFRSRPFSDMWREVWNCMKQPCRSDITHIEAQELHNTLDGYLKKHKFCQECRTKVEKAYSLLVNESNPTKEKGYVAALYFNIRRCVPAKHIHLQAKADFIDSLIKRAEPELNGSNSRHRERHAKTLEIAQEEVLTCIGMCIYERLRRVHMCLKEEENACQVLAAVAVHALCRSFDIAVEKKRGISNLELLYKEISRAEKAKELRKEQKKLKKKKKKTEKKNMETMLRQYCNCMDNIEGGVDGIDAAGEMIQCTCAIDDENGYDTEEQDVGVNMCCNKIMSSIVEPLLLTGKKIGNGGGGGSGGGGENSGSGSGGTKMATLGTTGGGGGGSSGKGSGVRINSGGGSTSTCCGSINSDEISIDVKDEQLSLYSCHSYDNGTSIGCSKSIDGGYVSEPSFQHDGPCSSVLSSHNNSRTSSLVSSPEGSEVACSDGFCNHDSHHGGIHSHRTTPDCVTATRHSAAIGLPLTLQQMLDDSPSEDDERECVNVIPDEVVLDFKCREQNIKKLREELRQNLRNQFAQLCVKTSMGNNNNNRKQKISTK